MEGARTERFVIRSGPGPGLLTGLARLAASAGALAAALAAVAAAFEAAIPAQALAACAAAAAAALLLLHLGEVVEEGLEVVPGVGVVLTAARRHGGARSSLIDAERIRAVLINEAVTTTHVHFYLGFVLHGAPEMAVAFPTLLPRLEQLRPVYQAVQSALPPAT
ncbi:MAG: hypothetical protein J3K34DRAFT_416227 [Monoraphidium minutum]|nr:MAG: hypothetical protein J3K34DRAFT_416227 [Monoraphidium minutum]